VIVDDSQCFGYYLKTFFQFSTPHALFGSMASHLGWGLPAALGVKHARPEAPVVAIVGDSGFLFAGHALAAAASWSVPLIVLVANNGGAVSLRTELHVKHATSGAAIPLATPSAAADLAGIARQSGAAAFSVNVATDLVPALREAVGVSTRSMRPSLIDVHMTQELSDWSEAWSVK
jgi:acetolactate synthase-1/2/3 large subunit